MRESCEQKLLGNLSIDKYHQTLESILIWGGIYSSNKIPCFFRIYTEIKELYCNLVHQKSMLKQMLVLVKKCYKSDATIISSTSWLLNYYPIHRQYIANCGKNWRPKAMLSYQISVDGEGDTLEPTEYVIKY